MRQIPSDKTLDSTIAAARDPYHFIARRSRRLRSEVFQTRLLLQKTICMTGADAAELFYDQERFVRYGAAPYRIQKTLFGRGGVQGLDGAAHEHRKAMFMELMTPERIRDLTEVTARIWQNYAQKWTTVNRVVLYDELQGLLTRAVCSWSGVPLDEREVRLRAKQLTALFDYAGNIGPRHWWSRLQRINANGWMANLVRRTRSQTIHPDENTALYKISFYRDPDGHHLPSQIAAVEVLNVIRPTVAVSVFITFVAHALEEHPECRRKLQSGDNGYAEWFVQEVRRFYPFFPAVAARVKRDFEWHGYQFPQNTRVLLDLYGTNHDPRFWDSPEEFRPERFQNHDPGKFAFIPQGGGDYAHNHRCPGEWIAIQLMKLAANILSSRMSYEIPQQDLRIDFARLPALPRSRFVISKVRPDESSWLDVADSLRPAA